MGKTFQEPVIDREPGGQQDQKITHPAFAQMEVTRVSGQTNLYGTDFNHQHTISLRLYASEQYRGLSNDRYHHAVSPMMDVSMSESQWATLIASVGMGCGVPVTLESFNGESIPGIKWTVDRRAQFQAEANQRLDRAVEALAELSGLLDSAKLTQKARAEMQSKVFKAKQDLESNLPFVAKQFDEHMTRSVEHAKGEITAFAQASPAARAALSGGGDVLSLGADLNPSESSGGA